MDVVNTIETALNSLKENSTNSEIAFFGGSFTALDRSYMLSLLDATVPYIDRFKGIRISTRPDAIDDEILTILKRYHVTAIELGAQSMSDDVLNKNDRGHTSEDVRTASERIKAYGFELGLQMMTGLYGSTPEADIATAKAFIALHPDTVRIYPTIVMDGTRLGELYNAGLYHPQDLNSAIELCAALIPLFTDNNIRVIRVGLHDSESLKNHRLAGPYHPAFRELCESRIMLTKAISLLGEKEKGTYTLRVHPKSRSKMTGNKKQNLIALKELGYEITIIEDESMTGRGIKLDGQ